MKIKTESGNVIVNKKTKYTKFLQGYLSTGAFSGRGTLAAAREQYSLFAKNFPSVSAYDCGRIIGYAFLHKPNERFMGAICPGFVSSFGESKQ